MYIFKNAWKSITRSKGRNILIGIIVVVIAVSSCMALSIRNSAEQLIASYENAADIEGELTVNRESMKNEASRQKEVNATTPQEFMNSIERLTVDQIKSYGDSIYVDEYYYSIQTEFNSSDITKATTEQTNNTQTNRMPGGMEMGKENANNKETGDFKVIGYDSLDGMSEFINGTYQISQGTMFDTQSTDRNCVISDDLAEQNNLEVGSKITLVNPNQTSESYEFTVVGIYTDTSESTEFSMFSNAANQILTNAGVLNEIIEVSQENADSALVAQTSAKFKLTNANVITAFEEELTSKGLSDFYTLSTNLDSLESSIQPIQNLSTFATTFLIIVLVIGGIILFVINMLNIRERKYEIGVLRSIGMKKHMVLGQFVIELFAVTTAAIIIGTIIGSVLTVPVANSMLQSEITALQESNTKVNQNFGREENMGSPSSSKNNGNMTAGPGGDIRNTFGNENVSYVDQLNAVIDVKTILQLVGIGIMLTLVSSSVSMILISRCSPLKILNNRT